MKMKTKLNSLIKVAMVATGIAACAAQARAKTYTLDLTKQTGYMQESSRTVGGVVINALSYSCINFDDKDWDGGGDGSSYSFSLESGAKITRIEMTCNVADGQGAGWTKTSPGYVWTGNAATVETGQHFTSVTQIVVTSDEPDPIPVTYVDAEGNKQTTNALPLAASDSRVTWNAGWYVVTNEVTLSKGADCSGAVHLILADTGKLTINGVADDDNAGIKVSGDNDSLAIYGQKEGTGALDVTGGKQSAGIGGGSGDVGKNITINGGKVMANGGSGLESAAGIGGGWEADGSNITINGGTVTANGGCEGAGIGGGCGGVGSSITINGTAERSETANGCTVTANGGGYSGAGIGGDTCSYIYINGGEVTANGGSYGVGIGGSSSSSNVFVADDVIVKAGTSANPTDEIAHDSETDIASSLNGKQYATAKPIVKVTVVLPEVDGASAQVFAFKVNGGWKAVETNAVPSNATVRVVWTADEGKGLWTNGVESAYQWQAAFGPVVGGEIAPAPAVREAGTSVVTVDLDTRTDKRYFRAEDILPVWYAAGAVVQAKGEGEQSWTTLVKNAANTNTLAWKPTAQDTYTLSHPGFGNATITLATPVEVTTNGLEVAGTTVKVTDESGNPLVAQTEGEFAGEIIVPSNSTVKVTWTATGAGMYFMDGTTTYTQSFKADKPENEVSAMVTKPDAPKAPSVKLGVVAQRYPWDGKLDVHYWAKNTPNEGYLLKVTATLPDGKEGSASVSALNGKNTMFFDMKRAFGEVTVKGVKVKAELEKSEE